MDKPLTKNIQAGRAPLNLQQYQQAGGYESVRKALAMAANDVLNTMIHENAHAQWSNNVRNNWTKVNTFTEKILSIGREGAITEYAGSYFDDLEIVKKENEGKWEKEVEYTKNIYGKADHQTEEEFQNWKFQNVVKDLANRKKSVDKEVRDNIGRVERLIANETHSEYFGMVGAPTEKSYHTVDTVKLEEMSKLIKEGFYD